MTSRIFLFVLLLLATSLAQAKPKRGRYQIYFSGFGDPYPSHVGANFGLLAAEYLQFGWGFSVPVSGVFTVGGYGRVFLPNWNCSPTLGLHSNHVLGKEESLAPTGGLSIYLNVGIDWQVANGLNVGAGLNFLIAKTSKTISGTLPYINVGWYFGEYRKKTLEQRIEQKAEEDDKK